MIIGIVIGAGIYETAPIVLSNVASPAAAIGIWVFGGVLSLIGATCYAELASTYPRSGGDYVYLSRAYGSFVGFLFAWAQLAVIMTASIGMMAYVFADYAVALGIASAEYGAALAAAAVLALTGVNIASVTLGKTAQNALSLLKLFGVLAIVAVGVLAFSARDPGALAGDASPAARGGSLGLALILVLYTFGGWNDAAFVAAEVKQPGRNLPRALLLGTAAVTLVYVAMNAAFMAGLGFERARASNAIASDLFATVFGPLGAAAIALLIMISALGAVNALIFTGARVHASLGADFSVLSRLSRWHPRYGSPLWALAAQLVITLGMILLVGTSGGRALFDGLLVALGLAPGKWAGHGGFDALLTCTAPVFWGFFFLTGASVVVLRRKDRHVPRVFGAPLYPLTPLLFCATCAFMLYSAIDYAGALTLAGAIPLLIGVPLYFASARRPIAAVEPPAPLSVSAE
jgi:amino acid transporter